MKIAPLFTLFAGALCLAGCASTEESAAPQGAAIQGSAPQGYQTSPVTGSTLLMDQYKTGQIPGYRD